MSDSETPHLTAIPADPNLGVRASRSLSRSWCHVRALDLDRGRAHASSRRTRFTSTATARMYGPLAIAEAGLNNGLATVTKADRPEHRCPSGRPYTSGGPVQLDKGTFTYSATKQAAPNCTNALPTCWIVTATSTSPTGQVTHQLQQAVGWISKTTTHFDRRIGRLRLWPLHQQSARRRQLLRDLRWSHRQGERLVQRQLLPQRQREPHRRRWATCTPSTSAGTTWAGTTRISDRPPPRSRKPTSSGSARSRTLSRRAATRRTATSTRIPPSSPARLC